MSYTNQEKDSLIDKLKSRTLTEEEANRLNKILEDERRRAIKIGDFMAVVGAGILIALVADYLSKNKFDILDWLGLKKRKKRK